MHPNLFELAGIPVRSYGLLVALGFIVGLLLSVRAGRRQGVPVERTLDLVFWILVSSLLGSRLLHLITEWGSYFRRCVGSGAPRGPGRWLYDCTAALHLWEGGLVFYGGFLAATAAVLWYCRRHRLRFLEMADLLAPSLAIGHFFGRLGCFAAGCCYGAPTGACTGLRFPTSSVAYQEMQRAGLLAAGASSTPPLHPTQLYEAVVELAIAMVLLLIARRKRWHGRVLATYAGLYAAARFVIEVFRADPDRRYVFRLVAPGLNALLGLPTGAATLLSTSQLLSLLVLAGAALLALWQSRQARIARAT